MTYLWERDEGWHVCFGKSQGNGDAIYWGGTNLTSNRIWACGGRSGLFCRHQDIFTLFKLGKARCVFYIYMEIQDWQWIHKSGGQRRGPLPLEFYSASLWRLLQAHFLLNETVATGVGPYIQTFEESGFTLKKKYYGPMKHAWHPPTLTKNKEGNVSEFWIPPSCNLMADIRDPWSPITGLLSQRCSFLLSFSMSSDTTD